LNSVVIYTDGACKGNPGPGGWGALLQSPDGTEKELFGGELGTTNNRMEMMAVIQALTILKRPCTVTLHLDSQYVLKGITEWLAGWKAKGWKTAAKQPVKNVDLWQQQTGWRTAAWTTRCERARPAVLNHAFEHQYFHGISFGYIALVVGQHQQAIGLHHGA
jgi:ribonuclease HI